MLSLKITAGAHDALKAVWEWIQTTRLQHLAGEPESTDGMKDGHTHCNITHCSSEFLMTPQTKHFCHCHLPLKPDVYHRSDRETAHSLANNSTITSYWSVRISWIIIVFTSLNEKTKKENRVSVLLMWPEMNDWTHKTIRTAHSLCACRLWPIHLFRAKLKSLSANSANSFALLWLWLHRRLPVCDVV